MVITRFEHLVLTAILFAAGSAVARPPEPVDEPAAPMADAAKPAPPEAKPPDGTVSFRRDVAPILVQHCVACHGPDKAQSNYRLDTFERAKKPGDNELAPFTPGKTDESEWLRLVTSTDKKERMPKDGDALPAAAVTAITKWVSEGAKFDGPDEKAALSADPPRQPHPAPPEAYPAPAPVVALAFHPSGGELAVGGYHEVTIWNPADGKLLRRLKNMPQRTHAIRYTADGSALLVAGGTPGRVGEAKLVSAADGAEQKLLVTTADEVFDAALAPDGKRIAVASADRAIRIFQAETGTLVKTIENHADWVMAVAWSGDGTKLASASRDKTAKVYDAATGQLIVTFSTHNETVYGVAFAADGNTVFSSGRDNKIRQWKVADAAQVGEVGFGGEVFKLVVDDKFLFVPSADKSARQFKLNDRGQVRSFGGASDWLYAVASHTPTKRVAASGYDGRVFVWNLDDGKVVTQFVAAPGFAGK